MTQNLLHNACPRVDLKKKRDIFALHSKTFQSENILLFDPKTLKEFSKKISSLNVNFKHKSGQIMLDVSYTKERTDTGGNVLGRNVSRSS